MLKTLPRCRCQDAELLEGSIFLASFFRREVALFARRFGKSPVPDQRGLGVAAAGLVVWGFMSDR